MRKSILILAIMAVLVSSPALAQRTSHFYGPQGTTTVTQFDSGAVVSNGPDGWVSRSATGTITDSPNSLDGYHRGQTQTMSDTLKVLDFERRGGGGGDALNGDDD